MMNILRRTNVVWGAVCFAVLPCTVEARDLDSADTLYSQGVHAYFAGRSSEGELLLSRAMELASQDPRIYYYRALCLLRLGRSDQARGDMMVGAALEAERVNRYAIGKALERVQGSDRLLLERYRRQARSHVAADSTEVSRRRRGPVSADDTAAIREPVVVPLDELLRPKGPRSLTAQELSRRSPIWPAAESAPAQAAGAEASPPAAVEDPFREDAPAPAQEPPAPSATEPTTPTPPEPTEEAGENPFESF